MKPEVRELWMGHVSAVSWVYQNPELHEEYFVREYREVESNVSLSQVERVIEERVSGEYDERLARLESEMRTLLQNGGRASAQSPSAFVV